jgi:hypothetical protein
MNVVKEKNEIIVRIPENIDMPLLQGILDYISAKLILSKSKGNQKQANEIADDIEKNWWKKNKKKYTG